MNITGILVVLNKLFEEQIKNIIYFKYAWWVQPYKYIAKATVRRNNLSLSVIDYIDSSSTGYTTYYAGYFGMQEWN